MEGELLYSCLVYIYIYVLVWVALEVRWSHHTAFLHLLRTPIVYGRTDVLRYDAGRYKDYMCCFLVSTAPDFGGLPRTMRLRSVHAESYDLPRYEL